MTAILEPKKKIGTLPLSMGWGGRKNQEKLFTSISFARSATCEIYSPFNGMKDEGRGGAIFPLTLFQCFPHDAEKPHFPHYFILSSSSSSSAAVGWDWHTFQFSFTEERENFTNTAWRVSRAHPQFEPGWERVPHWLVEARWSKNNTPPGRPESSRRRCDMKTAAPHHHHFETNFPP